MSLYKSDEQIAGMLGIGRDKFLDLVKHLEHDGFPRKDPQFSRKRYWPAVRAWLDRRNGLGQHQAEGARSSRVRERERWENA